MIILKAFGIALAVIVVLIVIALLLSVKLVFVFDTCDRFELKVKYLFFTLYDINKPKKEKVRKDKKPSRLGEYAKRLFGLDKLTAEAIKDGAEGDGISSTVNSMLTLIMLLLGNIKWLLSRVRVKKLYLLAICGGEDAADAAMEYGYVCSAVYPFVGYLESSVKLPEKAVDIQVGCDFEGEARAVTEIIAKLRVIHALRALVRSAVDAATNKEATGERKQS